MLSFASINDVEDYLATEDYQTIEADEVTAGPGEEAPVMYTVL